VRWVLGLALLVNAATALAGDTEVDYLLNWIRGSGCIFVRNGDDHSAVAAADHLGIKYRRARRWVASADLFITRIASKSSLSGKLYTVRCPGQPEETSRTWLTRALTEHRGHL
jgi:hypothetical protein